MKSSMLKNRIFLECDCYSPDHLLVVDVLEEDEQPDGATEIFLAEIAFMSDYRAPWYNRLWYALGYVFKRKSYYVSDSICMSDRNIEQFEELVNIFKKQKRKLKDVKLGAKEPTNGC